MKIIVLSTQYPVGDNNRNGMYIYRTTKELSKIYDITVIALHPVIPPIIPMLKNILSSVNIYKQWRSKYPRHPEVSKDFGDVKVSYINYIRPPRPRFMFLEAWGAYFSTKKIIKEIYDSKTIIHSNWIFPEGHLARILSKKLKIPYIVSLRGSEFIYVNNKNLNGFFAQRVFDSASKITAVASELFNQALENGIQINKNKFMVLNDFYDFRKFEIRNRENARNSLKLDNDKVYILFPGALRKIKNIYTLIKSIKHLVDTEKINVHLNLAGYGYEENNLKLFINELGLNNRVTFLGNLKEEELIQYYNSSDLICLPSYSEGFPTVIVESLLCGIPVVASAVGGIPEIIKENFNGYLIDPNSVESLNEGILRCIHKSWNRQELRESVSFLSRDKLMKQYMELYKSTLDNSIEKLQI